MRSDAAANRAKIIAAASAAFSERGNEVPLDDIARSAGVGPGTVHRHFRTKADLVDAVLANSVAEVLVTARERAASASPGLALRTFLEHLVVGGADAHELSHRLGGSADDVERAVAEPVADLNRELDHLLRAAKNAGDVAPEVDRPTLAAVIASAHAAYVHPGGGAVAMSIVLDGLVVTAE